MVDSSAIIYGFFTNIFAMIVGVALVGLLIWWLFVRRKTRKWHVNIFEGKEDNRLFLVDTDTLEEKYKGKHVIYILKKLKQEVCPPNEKNIYINQGKKDCCDYLRLSYHYIPVKRQLEHAISANTLSLDKYAYELNKLAQESPEYVESNYIYCPTAPQFCNPFNYNVEPMSHDLSGAMVNAIALRDNVYKDEQSWLEKNMPMIVIMLCILAVIITGYEVFHVASVSSGTFIGPMNKLGETLAASVQNHL